jgi:hypothetical protein
MREETQGFDAPRACAKLTNMSPRLLPRVHSTRRRRGHRIRSSAVDEIVNSTS